MAKDTYIPVMIASVAEFVLLAVLMIFVVFTLKKLIIAHTAILPTDDKYSHADRDYHRRLTTKVYIYGAFGLFLGIMKLAGVIFDYFTKITLVATDGGVGNTVSGMIPWFGTAIGAVSIAFIIISMYIFSTLKDEVDMKYS